jgi:hypothetical protein
LAKQKSSIIKLKGKLGDQTFVSSPTYGDHVRSNRGSIKPAPVNTSLRQNADRTSLLNNTAGPIFRALDQHTSKIRHRQLWQQMLGRLRDSKGSTPGELLDAFIGLELNDKHPYQALFTIEPSVIVQTIPNDLHIHYDPGRLHPRFPKEVTHYRYGILAIFPTESDYYPPPKPKGVKSPKLPVSASELCYTDWISLKDKRTAHDFRFDIPPGTSDIVLCFLIHAREGLYEIPSAWAKRAALLSIQPI